jgi:hypothetical protein
MLGNGLREVLGMAVGPTEVEPLWSKLPSSWRGPRGASLVISDTREGLRAAPADVLGPDLAALPRALHEERPGARGGEAAPDGGSHHPHAFA